MERSFPILTPANHGKEVGLALWSRGTGTVPGDSLDRIPPSLGHHHPSFVPALRCHQTRQALVHLMPDCDYRGGKTLQEIS